VVSGAGVVFAELAMFECVDVGDMMGGGVVELVRFLVGESTGFEFCKFVGGP
jgi:hypothetical protein